MKTFNLNNSIKVKPNPQGVELIKKAAGHGIKYEPDADGYVEMPGWALMMVFGREHGTINMNILIKDKDLK